MHESQLYNNNIFITLTYNKQNVPTNGSINKRHYQLFMKRLRKKYSDKKIRFFHCGEYGELCKVCGENRDFCRKGSCKSFIPILGRPHYHAILFNFDLEDKKFLKEKNGHKMYTSEILNEIWGMGYCTIGDVTFESAAYVARYSLKKVHGKKQEEHYQGRTPEYITMSRGGSGKGEGGIGKGWFKKYSSDVYPDDFVLSRGKKLKPPKFYDLLLEAQNPEKYLQIKQKRAEADANLKPDNQHKRLLVREKVQIARYKQLIRHDEI